MKKAHILLIEDNEGDILLITEALEERDFIKEISVVKDGEKALEYIFNKVSHQDQNLPDLILMDINIPKKSGHEVLQTIKVEEQSKHIPVIMMSTSSSEKDMELAYLYNANYYITKPVDMDALIEAVDLIEGFWKKWNEDVIKKES